jgi:hypothetical protein
MAHTLTIVSDLAVVTTHSSAGPFRLIRLIEDRIVRQSIVKIGDLLEAHAEIS